jgi:AcrR family transcriptional regulator
MSPRGKEQNNNMRSETLEKITGGALSVFADFGYYGATMKMISDASGLSYGLVYHYFKSKEEIFLFLVNLALERMQEVFGKGLDAEGTAWEKLSHLSRVLLEESLKGDSVLFLHIMLQALTLCKRMPGLKENIDQSSALVYEKLIPVVVEAQGVGEAAPGDPLAMVTAYSSLVQGLALFSFQDITVAKRITPEILLNVIKR